MRKIVAPSSLCSRAAWRSLPNASPGFLRPVGAHSLSCIKIQTPFNGDFHVLLRPLLLSSPLLPRRLLSATVRARVLPTGVRSDVLPDSVLRRRAVPENRRSRLRARGLLQEIRIRNTFRV